MSISMNPALVRRGWQHATDARGELADARAKVTDAAGTGLEDLQATLTDAAQDMDGVLEVVQAVIDEIGTNVEECIATYEKTDGRSDGHFHELAR
jgi:hypothetical protein